jgi:hypothetical protein
MELPKLACTLIAGRYHGTGYDYAPFVCIHEVGRGPDLTQTELGAPDLNLRIIARADVPSAVAYGGTPELQTEAVARIEEMVRRVNALGDAIGILKGITRAGGRADRRPVCGGGGASVGIEWALGARPTSRSTTTSEAISMHRVNHPDTKHYIENVWRRPAQGLRQEAIALMWLSPDCKHFSKAKGGEAGRRRKSARSRGSRCTGRRR